MRGLLNALDRHAAERPRDAAVLDADGTVRTWSAIQRGAARVEAWLAGTAGGERPTHVTIALPSGGGLWMAVLGAWRAGVTPILLPAQPSAMAERLVQDAVPGAPRIDAANWAAVQGCEEAPAAVAGTRACGLVLVSSGTTGHPRLVARGAQAVDRVAATLVAAGTVRAGDVVASCLPMSHAYGIEHACLAPLAAGACVRVLPAFTVDGVAEALAAGATTVLLVPATADALAEARVPAPALRQATVAGAPLPARVRRAFMAAYGVPLVDLYGATEVGTIWLDRGAGGQCVPGVRVRVVDPLADALTDVPEGSEGELAVHSDAMSDGVLGPGGMVQPIAVDGFVRMGDLGVRAADGGLRVTGRIKLVFDVAGLKVNPVEVEQALESHPEVRAAIVFASAVSDTLNRVAAHVELRDPARRPDPAALRQFLAAAVPAHAVPRAFEFVERLPRTPSGKILRGVAGVAPPSMPPVTARPAGLQDRAAREAFTKELFDTTAQGYDHSSGAAFLRVGRWYRRRMLVKVGGLGPGRAHLDVGSGTGLCAALSQQIVGPTGRTVALDPSTGMLEVARRRGVRETVVGRAEHLPFPDATFDLVSMSYMLRHVEDLVTAFREAHRVLRPGGRIVIFELTSPERGLPRAAFRAGMHWVVPAVGVVASLRPATFPMMQYWAQTIDAAVRPERIVAALDAAGFAGARHGLELGVFSCYRGVRAAGR